MSVHPIHGGHFSAHVTALNSTLHAWPNATMTPWMEWPAEHKQHASQSEPRFCNHVKLRLHSSKILFWIASSLALPAFVMKLVALSGRNWWWLTLTGTVSFLSSYMLRSLSTGSCLISMALFAASFHDPDMDGRSTTALTPITSILWLFKNQKPRGPVQVKSKYTHWEVLISHDKNNIHQVAESMAHNKMDTAAVRCHPETQFSRIRSPGNFNMWWITPLHILCLKTCVT